jgi:gliding motility-associated-like protein
VLTGVSATPPLQPAPEGPVNIDFTALYQAPAGSPVNFTWFFGDGGQYSSSQPQAAHLYSPGVYTLTLIAAIGDCRDTLTVTVEVLGSRQLIIPNVFTPNGDGINDVWIPVGAGIRRMDIRIYDRWGKILYQGAGPWRGEEAIEGVYTYVVDVEFLDGSRVSRAGTVTLLR